MIEGSIVDNATGLALAVSALMSADLSLVLYFFLVFLEKSHEFNLVEDWPEDRIKGFNVLVVV